jgi:hypothetical protein
MNDSLILYKKKETFIFPSNDKNWRRTFPFNIFSIREKDLERKESFTV